MGKLVPQKKGSQKKGTTCWNCYNPFIFFGGLIDLEFFGGARCFSISAVAVITRRSCFLATCGNQDAKIWGFRGNISKNWGFPSRVFFYHHAVSFSTRFLLPPVSWKFWNNFACNVPNRGCTSEIHKKPKCMWKNWKRSGTINDAGCAIFDATTVGHANTHKRFFLLTAASGSSWDFVACLLLLSGSQREFEGHNLLLPNVKALQGGTPGLMFNAGFFDDEN